MNTLNSFEIGILHSLHDALQCTFLDTIMPIITRLANSGIFWIMLALLLLFFKKTRRAGITMGIALILGLVFGNLLLKPLIARVRPYDFDPSIILLIPKEKDFSFPSGHTLSSVISACVLLHTSAVIGIIAVIMCAFILFSRMYLFVHYPSDVLGGISLGIIISEIVMMI